METCTVRLRALSGTPLADERVRSTVIAAAEALAERSSVVIHRLEASETALTLTLGIDKLAALGFLAELRRITSTWYEAKHKDGPLWGTAEESW